MKWFAFMFLLFDRELYDTQLAGLWPNALMDNHGIKRAICKAKERKKSLYNKHKVCELPNFSLGYTYDASCLGSNLPFSFLGRRENSEEKVAGT